MYLQQKIFQVKVFKIKLVEKKIDFMMFKFCKCTHIEIQLNSCSSKSKWTRKCFQIILVFELHEICFVLLHFCQIKWSCFATIHIQLHVIFQKQPSRGVFLVIGVLKICSKFKGEHPWQIVISIKWLFKFTEITLRHGCSPVNLLHFFFWYLQSPFF